MRPHFLAISALFATLVTPANADGQSAIVQDVEGSVFVQSATGATLARPGMPLIVGDRVVTGPEALTRLSLGGCLIEVAPENQFVVPTTFPCEAGNTFYAGNFLIRPTNGETIVGGAGLSGTTMAIGAAGLLTVVGIMTYSMSTKETDPSSPY